MSRRRGCASGVPQPVDVLDCPAPRNLIADLDQLQLLQLAEMVGDRAERSLELLGRLRPAERTDLRGSGQDSDSPRLTRAPTVARQRLGRSGRHEPRLTQTGQNHAVATEGPSRCGWNLMGVDLHPGAKPSLATVSRR